MDVMNPITMAIVKRAVDGDTIRNVAKKTGFAYSAVYKWVKGLERFGVFDLTEEGNRTIISVNKGSVYKKFIDLSEALETEERDRIFWRLIKRTRCRIRLIRDTAAVIWTMGGYITGDFYDKIYHVEVLERDFDSFSESLKKHNILSGKEDMMPLAGRPFVYLTSSKDFMVEKKAGLPLMPLKELVLWCQRLHLEPVLEKLDLMYKLGLGAKYSEVSRYG